MLGTRHSSSCRKLVAGDWFQSYPTTERKEKLRERLYIVALCKQTHRYPWVWSSLLRRQHRTNEKLVEMTNGCICCTLREDLLVEVANLAREGRFDYLLIESTGISEPAPVADTFTFSVGDGQALSDLAELDTMVTVVDAANFLNDLKVGQDLQSAGQAAGEKDLRTVADLLIEQVEFANV